MKTVAQNAAWLAIPVAVLVALQAFGLDGQPEKSLEEQTMRVQDLKVTSMLPAYIASLFLGSFRALAVDAAWIELSRAEREKRIYRKREILEFIKFLQPRNEEVHVLLSWNVLFNISATVATSERWNWEKLGLKQWTDALRILPGSLYVRYQFAIDLEKKSMGGIGRLNNVFIERFMGDPDVQEWVGGRPEQPLSPFECAIRNLADAKRMLLTYPNHQLTAPMGLNCTDYFADNLARNEFFYQAILLKQRRDFTGAQEWLSRAAVFTRKIITEYDQRPGSILYLYEKFFLRAHDAILVEQSGTERQILDTYTQVLKEHANLDERLLYTVASDIKRKMSRDLLEMNDRDIDATPIFPGRELKANIWPADDVDVYTFEEDRPAKGSLFPEHAKTLQIDNTGPVPLSVEVEWVMIDAHQHLGNVIVPPKQKKGIVIQVNNPGAYYIRIRSGDPNAAEGLDRTYSVRLFGPGR